MDPDLWRNVLAGALLVNALAGFSYRLYRYRKGGPLGDVWGQAILGVLLGALAVALVVGAGWPRWPALGYAALFAFVVMPIWTLAVLIPLPPERIDYAFTGLYWATLFVIGASALLV
jgi:hypothetical protein